MFTFALTAWWVEPLRYAIVLLVVAAVLFAIARAERRRIVNALAIYLAGIAVAGAAHIATSSGLAKFNETLQFIGVLLGGMAFVNIIVIAVVTILRLFRVETPRIVRDLSVAGSYIVLVIYLFAQHKVDLAGIIATSAVLTAVIGFSLQDVLANVMGGLALQLDRSITPGVWVKYGDVPGIVRETSWRFTSIETRNGDVLIIPNSLLVKNPLLVLGRPAGGGIRERRWVYFNVGYEHSPRIVIDAVTDALRREPIVDVAPEPQADCVLMEFQDSSCRYAVRYWLTNIQRDDPTDSVIRTRVYYALQRAQIPFAFPIARREHSQLPPPDPRIAARSRKMRLDAFSNVSIFRALKAEEVEKLAGRLVDVAFVAGEAVFVQGSTAHNLYILVKGSVEVRVSVEGAPATVLARLDAPDFFGEMGLLTGEPRRATIVATTDVECLRLSSETFEDIIQARPEIAEGISHILAERNVELQALKEGLSEEAKRLRIAAEKRSLLTRIETFFELR